MTVWQESSCHRDRPSILSLMAHMQGIAFPEGGLVNMESEKAGLVLTASGVGPQQPAASNFTTGPKAEPSHFSRENVIDFKSYFMAVLIFLL